MVRYFLDFTQLLENFYNHYSLKNLIIYLRIKSVFNLKFIIFEELNCCNLKFVKIKQKLKK